MINTTQKRILFIVIVLLYTAKIIYRYIQKNEFDYFDIGMCLFWLGILVFNTRKQEKEQ